MTVLLKILMTFWIKQLSSIKLYNIFPPDVERFYEIIVYIKESVRKPKISRVLNHSDHRLLVSLRISGQNKFKQNNITKTTFPLEDSKSSKFLSLIGEDTITPYNWSSPIGSRLWLKIFYVKSCLID